MQGPLHKNTNPVIELVTATIVANTANVATLQTRTGTVFGSPCEVLGVTVSNTNAATLDVDVTDVNGLLIASGNTLNDAVVAVFAAATVATGPFTVTTTNESATSAATIHIYVRR